MKKFLSVLIVIVVSVSLVALLSLSGCKEEAAPAEEAVEEAAPAEEAVEEAAPAEEAVEEAAPAEEKPYEGRTLKIHWAVFAPSDALQVICDDVFTPLTGIEVIVEQTPWSDFTSKYNAELIAGGDAWDIIIGDSQDVGNCAERGHFVEITEYVMEWGLKDKFTPECLSYFGEWPKGGDRYYGVPCLTDPTHFAYRIDLLEEDAEIAAGFEAEYGYELGVPATWDMLIDVANYFNDNVEGMYGIGVYGDNGYDSLNMFGETAIWCYGGELGDYETGEVMGIINSEKSIEGIEAYRKLFLTTPPGHGTAFFEENNNAYLSGLVPMVFNYTATFPALVNRETNPFYDQTGYFITPEGPYGDQYTSLGGQQASVISYSSNQDIAIEWLEWWCQDETQVLYSTYPGCFNASYAILNDPDFPTATPINQIAIDSTPILKDWWAVPEYAQTIRTFADTVGKYVIGGEGTAKEAMDSVAEQWYEVFEEAGYYD